MNKPLLIGELARLAGVKVDSVRFYERSGLLPQPARSANGYRVYAQPTVDQLRFIKKAQSLGFSLDEIKRILRLRGRSDCCRSVVTMAEATLEETERKLREMRRFAAALRKNLAVWQRDLDQNPTCAAEFCRLIEKI